jgi:beta-ureidopropionase
MARIVRCGLIQASCPLGPDQDTLPNIKRAMLEKQLALITQAAREGVKIVCLQELANGPYFCAEEDNRWHAFAESIPSGPTICELQTAARQHSMIVVAPIYETGERGLYYNTAAVIDADRKYLGRYRKSHIPYIAPGYYEKFYFAPGDLGYPVFETSYAKIGVYICYDRHFPEGARVLGLKGAEIVFNPCATCGHSTHLWELEQRALAVANSYFVATINRVGREEPWCIGDFYGGSYFCDPSGRIIAQGSEDTDQVVVADLNLDLITEVRDHWEFFRDRRPETYKPLIKP